MTTFVVNRFSPKMLSHAKSADLHIKIFEMSKKDFIFLLGENDTEIRSMTHHVANLLADDLGVQLRVTTGKFSLAEGDTLVQVSIHGESISGQPKLPKDAWLSFLAIKLVRINAE